MLEFEVGDATEDTISAEEIVFAALTNETLSLLVVDLRYFT